MPPDPSILASALEKYASICPSQAPLAEAFIASAQAGAGVFTRAALAGHFTGSAWLVSGDGKRALLMHHRKLDRWLQPGGHADGDTDLARVALREAGEESGLVALAGERDIFDLDQHRIPARGDEPAHWHYDVRYVVRAQGGETLMANDESLALAWKPICELAEDSAADASLQRMARKWMARSRAGS